MDEEKITILGREMTVFEAIDVVFRNLQSSLNDAHCCSRTLSNLCDVDESSFKKSYELSANIQDYSSDFTVLMKELNKITKYLTIKPEDSGEKQWCGEFEAKRKEDRKNTDLEKFI